MTATRSPTGGVKPWVIAQTRVYLRKTYADVAHLAARAQAVQTALEALARGRYGTVLAFLRRRIKYLAKMAAMWGLRGETTESRAYKRVAHEGERLYTRYGATAAA